MKVAALLQKGQNATLMLQLQGEFHSKPVLAKLCHEKSHSFVCIDCRKRYILFRKGCTGGIPSFINQAELGTFNTNWLSPRGKEIKAT